MAMPAKAPRKAAATTKPPAKRRAAASSSTPKNKKPATKKTAAEDDVPTLAQLQKDPAWVKYGKFKLREYDTVFHRGDYIFVLPPPPADGTPYHGPSKFDGDDDRVAHTGEYYWVALIAEIYAKSPEQVFLNVQWCFTDLHQLEEVGCANPPAVLHGRELVLSTFHDVIPVQSVSDRAHVIAYDETVPEHDAIDHDQPFYRSRLVRFPDMTPEERKSASGKKGQARKPHVFPLHPPSCSCGLPYEPLPLGEGSSMVYCGHDCQRWYHSACCSTAPADPRLLLEVQRSADDLPSHLTAPKGPLVPVRIVLAAQAALQRGTSATGIAGNGELVLRARRIAADWIAGAQSRHELAQEASEWAEDYGGCVEGAAARAKVYVCPGCGGAI